MPCLLVFTRSEETVGAVHDVANACGWDIEDGRASLLSGTLVTVDHVDAVLFDLCQGVFGVQELVQQISGAAPFLPLVFLSSQGTAVQELGSGLRYHIDPRQIPDLEHVLLSLSLGFPSEQFTPPENGARSSVPRVLIVDDNIQLASLIGRALRAMERYDVQVVTSGFEALSILPSFHPDVAIIDLVLRDMDGREICTFIRTHEKLQHTKIIGVSGYLSERRAEDDNVQCDLFIEKPFRMRDIVDKVVAFLP
jgi:CheY-like chemotaxis protein